MKLFLLMCTLILLFINIKNFIMKLVKTERKDTLEFINENKDIYQDNPQIVRMLIVILALLDIVYCSFIISTIYSPLIFILTLISMINDISPNIKYFSEMSKNEKEDWNESTIKLTGVGILRHGYTIGFLMYIFYNLIIKIYR